MEMEAEFMQDWNSNCTLLVCASFDKLKLIVEPLCQRFSFVPFFLLITLEIVWLNSSVFWVAKAYDAMQIIIWLVLVQGLYEMTQRNLVV